MDKNVVPMFHVPDVRKTVEWYRSIGFDVVATYDSAGGEAQSFAIVAFGGGRVMFSSGGWTSPRQRREVDLYVYTDAVDDLHERLKDRVDLIEGPHNMFYGMREVIVRDPNGFWVTFGQQISQEELTPWPAAPRQALAPYLGTYRSADGSGIHVTANEGRLLAFPEDSPGVYLRPSGSHTFTPVMSEEASVTFDVRDALAAGLTFTQGPLTQQFHRAAS